MDILERLPKQFTIDACENMPHLKCTGYVIYCNVDWDHFLKGEIVGRKDEHKEFLCFGKFRDTVDPELLEYLKTYSIRKEKFKRLMYD